MKKIRNFGIVCVSAASIVVAGSGLVHADNVDAGRVVADSTGSADSTATGSATGSANLINGLAKLLNTGSGNPVCPGGKNCP
ncbi:hypothetical protein [Nocardia sp. NPDC052566]|uniref:hypothetical protein n=1 Tax=Nocardia sp. NPDC052566 TaxID=3364330 RepID=UPI0037C94864